jgi:hypothetical protein
MTGKQQEDIHTLLGLLAGLQQTNGDSELMALLVEQLKVREDDSDDTAVSSQLSPEERQPLIAEIQMLNKRIDAAGDDEKLNWLRGLLKQRLKNLGDDC